MVWRDITLADIKGRCAVDPDTECWNWLNCVDDRGYPRLRTHGKTHYVKRFVYLMLHGSIPEKKIINSSCENNGCCNPDHLALKSKVKVARELAAKGRVSCGLRHSMTMLNKRRARAKLDMSKARSIRQQYADGKSFDDLAASYGVHYETIRHIITMKTWREPFMIAMAK